MPDIKTKDVVKGTIKKIDKAAVASQRMKQAYISTKDKAEHSVQPAESSETEYASNKVEEINTDYDNKLTEIKSSTEYDDLEMSGSRAVWKEVLGRRKQFAMGSSSLWYSHR